jgi:methionyl-tRNA formyltransferase
LSILPTNSLNLHLGLSPWYRGSATLFWPFYFMEPQYAGVTFHRLSEKPDAGKIVHQSCPVLLKGDGIHDVGARCVTDAASDAQTLIKWLCTGERLVEVTQLTSGRVWKTSDFKPSHLRVLYSLFDNDIVAQYLAHELGNRRPVIHNGMDRTRQVYSDE